MTVARRKHPITRTNGQHKPADNTVAAAINECKYIAIQEQGKEREGTRNDSYLSIEFPSRYLQEGIH